LVSELKSTQSEQSAKLQAKHEAEQDLLEDVRNYAKQRASIEKEYSQAILRITSQSLTKMASAAVKGQPTTTTDDTLVETEAESEDSLRTPQGLWKKILEETGIDGEHANESLSTLLNDVADSIKNLKVERVATLKKCSALTEKLQEEIVVSASDLVKAQKTYADLQKLTNKARQTAAEEQEKLQSGKVSILSSKAKLEKNASKATERKEASEKRSTIARNDYLLSLAAINAHQRKCFSQDLPDLIAMQDGKIYENLKEYFTIITNIDRDAAYDHYERLYNMEGSISALDRAYVIMCFLKQNSIFTKCEPYEFNGVPGDESSVITEEHGAGLTLNREARKWTLRLAREQKQIRSKSKKLQELKSMSQTDAGISASTDSGTSTDDAKTTEQSIEALTDEIRHLEVLKTKAEGRVEALKLAGVNVDEWMQQASFSFDQDDGDNTSQTNDMTMVDEDDFNDDEWDDPYSPRTPDNASVDALSMSSSAEQRRGPNQAVVLYPFEATSQEELSIAVGEELELIETEADGWCRTRNRLGEIGFVPETYIEVKWSSNTVSEDGDSVSKVSSLTSSCVSEVQIEYSGTSLNSLNYSDMETTPTPLSLGFQAPPTPVTPVPTATTTTTEPGVSEFVCLARAVYSYTALEDEELTFAEGDVIGITSKIVDDDDGWWEGVLNDHRGVFPCLLVEETSQAPDHHHSTTRDDTAISSHSNYLNTNQDCVNTRSATLGHVDLSGFRGGNT